MTKKLFSLSVATFLLSPFFALAVAFVPPAPPAIGGIDIFAIIPVVIGNIIGFLWIIFGGFAIGMFIYAGFLFLASHGDSSKIKDARNALIWGAVGVAVGLLAQVLPWFIASFFSP